MKKIIISTIALIMLVGCGIKDPSYKVVSEITKNKEIKQLLTNPDVKLKSGILDKNSILEAYTIDAEYSDVDEAYKSGELNAEESLYLYAYLDYYLDMEISFNENPDFSASYAESGEPNGEYVQGIGVFYFPNEISVDRESVDLLNEYNLDDMNYIYIYDHFVIEVPDGIISDYDAFEKLLTKIVEKQ